MKTVYIDDLDNAAALPYSHLTEAQLKRAGDFPCGLFIAESLNVISAAADAGHSPVSFLAEEKRISGIEEAFGERFADAPILTAGPDTLKRLTGFGLSRGVLCAMERKPLPKAEELLRGARRVAVLEGIVDPANVGSVMRSAAALGIDAVLLAANCCDPLHRRAARVSMGGVFRVPFAVLPCLERDKNAVDLSLLRSFGFLSAAMALEKDSLRLDDERVMGAEKLALVFGTEGAGLSPATVSSCDLTVMIPMENGMDSLNIAVSAAIAFWQTCGQNGPRSA